MAFSKRQDCDDLACFVIAADNTVSGVALIHGWTASGYDLRREFDDFWAWLKYVVDDIAGWVSVGE
jgi:hypothetical protein